jgi:hypothetical protein
VDTPLQVKIRIKIKNRKNKGNGSHDPDAHWGVKYRHHVKNEKGEEVTQTEYSFDYKAHVSMNAESGLITNFEPLLRGITSGDGTVADLSKTAN